MKQFKSAAVKKCLSCFIGFGILLAYFYISAFLVKVFSLHFPAALVGLILLCASLQLKFFPKQFIKDISDLLLKHMVLFFVPLTVGIIAYAGIIKSNLLSILIIVSAATFISFTVTALFVENMIKYTKLKKIKGAEHD